MIWNYFQVSSGVALSGNILLASQEHTHTHTRFASKGKWIKVFSSVDRRALSIDYYFRLFELPRVHARNGRVGLKIELILVQLRFSWSSLWFNRTLLIIVDAVVICFVIITTNYCNLFCFSLRRNSFLMETTPRLERIIGLQMRYSTPWFDGKACKEVFANCILLIHEGEFFSWKMAKRFFNTRPRKWSKRPA